ncbi:MAG TPA: peptidylprolyl isomerase [Enhygromyxa sp.]|nr:peptidylprolyl isomerase [Enhygromyxa sp.]
MRVRQIALIGLLALGAACRNRGSSGAAQDQNVDGPSAAGAQIEDAGLPSWGAEVPSEATTELLATELARRGGDPQLLAALQGAERERALWSLARIGGADARERLLIELDASEPAAIAATALLEVPRVEPGSPPEPLEGDSWGLLEDALWTRYAVSDPAATQQHRALLLAIARIGGSRSLLRLGVDLAERPGADHRPEIIARWSAGMDALGLMCARGLTLERTTAAAMAGGLERRTGPSPSSPEVTLASLFALSRCARSSGELLVESRELLVERLTPHVHTPESPTHAALAWRSFAALGDAPAEIPAGIVGATPPEWTVEVEAVRALGSSRTGAAVLRARLRERSIEQFAGPRQHVLIAALQAMRGSIASADAAVDAELVSLGELLLAGRRSENARLRKASALALCELRLLQAIRTGETESLRRCDQLADAPAVELPESLLVNLEIEALLRSTRAEATRDNLGTATIDDEAVIADQPSEPPVDPRRRARIDRLLELARDRSPARASAGLHALAEIDDPATLPVLRAALLSDDAGILAAAATAIAVRSVDASKRDLEAVPLLEDLVRERSTAADLEARLSAIEALGALARSAVANIDPTGSAPSGAPPASPWLARTVVPLARDPNVAVRTRAREALLGHAELLLAFDRAELESATSRPSPFPAELATHLDRFLREDPWALQVRTEAGTFTIAFEGAAAPINQANLMALAEAGFFDGLSFHRVVPGFVTQGGDPRGDGYGGPGYVVPCEWSNLRYERGTVGIALAGKDTGGSQFFITHTPQPHLDARYTVVGHVVDGMDTVDQLLPGDRIESVRVLHDEG